MNLAARTGHIPTRTCVGCRKRMAATNLVRFVNANGHLALAGKPRQPGRGVWLCPSTACARVALRTRGFQRTLRAPVSTPAEAELLSLLGLPAS